MTTFVVSVLLAVSDSHDHCTNIKLEIIPQGKTAIQKEHTLVCNTYSIINVKLNYLLFIALFSLVFIFGGFIDPSYLLKASQTVSGSALLLLNRSSQELRSVENRKL